MNASPLYFWSHFTCTTALARNGPASSPVLNSTFTSSDFFTTSVGTRTEAEQNVPHANPEVLLASVVV